MSTSLYEPNFLASLKDDAEDAVDPAELVLPTPPPPPPPSYPTALVPPVGPPYQPWEDPRYALGPMPHYKPVYVQQHQAHVPQPAPPAPEYYTPPAASPSSTASTLQNILPQAPTSSYMMPPQHLMHQQQLHYYSMQAQPPVNVPVFRPSNFPIPALRRNNSSHMGTPAKRPTPSLPPRMPVPARKGLYEATYSNVPVYEMASPNGVGVMRRRHDSWMNATHILKAAGMEKSRRTKVLEREIHQGEHEKIQGGYGKYQGTWIPLYRARELAAEYGLDEALRDILDLPE
ncbi:uncharacterized protein SPPG_02210 [Spizellomyces punctatus DAOM BR117]|uniref:HTH APSES-type domain-containing protein n=1 Tax=Spizellomyces punctatus (strain DAOM BR117) TaxID=645134 RepID=A0A0L0HPY0_SPIPD|nr:uncharacterized protein SPPG_02210 [Spizellomyces punctatus DAOM BR117]KND03147.1 hypothetical protein SPPG_02210 [Spizellomyces punctatus DAOM BR117]|eukprot:XP_016611186.1 hypothetical protein SPPG_02210 [Spizellomyces punctatus DAOM BR117]